MKTFGLADQLRRVLRPVTDKIETAFVFGSMADGTEKAASDIDLLVIGDIDLFEISPLLAKRKKVLVVRSMSIWSIPNNGHTGSAARWVMASPVGPRSW